MFSVFNQKTAKTLFNTRFEIVAQLFTYWVRGTDYDHPTMRQFTDV